MKLAASAKCGFSQTLLPVKSDKFPTPLPFHLRVISWALAILLSSTFYIGPLLLILPVIPLKYDLSIAVSIAILDSILVLLPVKEWRQFATIFQLWYGLFNLHTNVKDSQSDTFALSEKELAIVAMHPHAIMPLHSFIYSALCDQMFPHIYGIGAASDIVLRVPILRHILGFLSTKSAKKGVLLKSMQIDGHSLFILPGGVAERFLSHRHPDKGASDNSDNGHMQTIKAKRFGLMKLALETGAAIIPAYAFGATDMFDQLMPVDRGSCANLHKSKKMTVFGHISETIESISRRIQLGVTLFWGKGYLPIPHTPQISMVFGDPIYPVPGTERSEPNINGGKLTCKKVPNPSEEQVLELMGRYTEALHCLFEQYKAEAGYAKDELEII